MNMFGSLLGDKTIAVCECGKNGKHEPLVSTFAFRGAEYWCAKCGNRYGMMGTKRVEWTRELEAEAARRKELAGEYLHAWAVVGCHKTLFNGEWIKPNDLPQSEKDRLKAIREAGFKLPETEVHP